jgi:deoxycytidylate deaminase
MSQINYPYLPAGRTILYVDSSNEFMKAAEVACGELSTDKYHPTGAVLVRDGKIIARAANQSALKSEKLLEWHRKGLCVRKLLKIPSGKKYWLCPGCASSKNHAETLAVKTAEKLGVKTDGADLYLWGHWWCCRPCWDSMISGGIRNVYLLSGSDRIFNQSHKS